MFIMKEGTKNLSWGLHVCSQPSSDGIFAIGAVQLGEQMRDPSDGLRHRVPCHGVDHPGSPIP